MGNSRLVALFLACARPNDVRADVARNSTTVYAYGFPSRPRGRRGALRAPGAADGPRRRRSSWPATPTWSSGAVWNPRTRTFGPPSKKTARLAFYEAFVEQIATRLWAARARRRGAGRARAARARRARAGRLDRAGAGREGGRGRRLLQPHLHRPGLLAGRPPPHRARRRGRGVGGRRPLRRRGPAQRRAAAARAGAPRSRESLGSDGSHRLLTDPAALGPHLPGARRRRCALGVPGGCAGGAAARARGRRPPPHAAGGHQRRRAAQRRPDLHRPPRPRGAGRSGCTTCWPRRPRRR